MRPINLRGVGEWVYIFDMSHVSLTGWKAKSIQEAIEKTLITDEVDPLTEPSNVADALMQMARGIHRAAAALEKLAEGHDYPDAHPLSRYVAK